MEKDTNKNMKNYLWIGGIGLVLAIAFLLLLDPFFDRFDFKFRSPIELYWPVKLEKRLPIEIIKYKLVTPTPSLFPRFKLNNGRVE